MKQQSVDRHVDPLRHIILILIIGLVEKHPIKTQPILPFTCIIYLMRLTVLLFFNNKNRILQHFHDIITTLS